MDSVLSNSSYLGNGSLVSFQFQFPSQNRIIHEEILIFDEIGLLGSLGGALGMFLGKRQNNHRTGKAKLFHVASIYLPALKSRAELSFIHLLTGSPCRCKKTQIKFHK